MTAHCLIGGRVWVDALWPAGGMEHSSMYRVDDPSGDDEAQVTLSVPAGFETDWTVGGQSFQFFSPTGGLLWGGLTEEPDRAPGKITLHAKGLAWALEEYDARVPANDIGPLGEDGWLPTFIPNEAVDAAIARGAPFSRHTSLGATSVAEVDEDEKQVSVGEVLRRAAISEGKRVHVDSAGVITFVADPTTPTLITDPIRDYMGTADSQFASALAGYFRTSAGPFVAVADDPVAARKFGVRERRIDLSNLGQLTVAAGTAYTQGRFTLIGGRMGWTRGVDLTRLNLRHINGAWFGPQWAKAGVMLRIPGVIDSRSNPTTAAAIDIILSQVRIIEETRPYGRAEPVGFSPRDYAGALAPPEKPADKEFA